MHQDDTNWANRTLVVKLLVSNVKKKIQRFLFTFFFCLQIFVFMQGIDGSRVEKVLESVHIAANKNTVPGDVSAMVPGGIRMGNGLYLTRQCSLILFTANFLDKCNCTSGTPALTSRGFVEEDFAKVADFFDASVKLAVKMKAETKGL